MTFDEAKQMVADYLSAYGVDSDGLDDSGMGGVSVGHLEVYFQYGPAQSPTDPLSVRCQPKQSAQPSLAAFARVYTFIKEPSEELHKELKREEQQQQKELQGAVVQYLPQNQGLFLSRSYTDTVPAEQFKEEIDALLWQTEAWTEGILERCLQRACA